MWEMKDDVTGLAFSHTSLLLVSSWDAHLRVYDIAENKLLNAWKGRAPLLDVGVSMDGQCFTGGLDRQLMELGVGNQRVLGDHDDAIRCIKPCHAHASILTGSWDKTCKIWDTRLKDPLVETMGVPLKVFSMDVVGETLAVAMADRLVHVYDVRNLQSPLETRTSPLKLMTRQIRLMPNSKGFAISSIEGRIAIEYFSKEEQAQKYAFKCHRQSLENEDVVFAVNALAFHPEHGTFASGGGDGLVNLWDGSKKKRLKQWNGFPSGITSLAFDARGSVLAVGCGNGSSGSVRLVSGEALI